MPVEIIRAKQHHLHSFFTPSVIQVLGLLEITCHPGDELHHNAAIQPGIPRWKKGFLVRIAGHHDIFLMFLGFRNQIIPEIGIPVGQVVIE
jgi:hypothetical protein